MKDLKELKQLIKDVNEALPEHTDMELTAVFDDVGVEFMVGGLPLLDQDYWLIEENGLATFEQLMGLLTEQFKRLISEMEDHAQDRTE